MYRHTLTNRYLRYVSNCKTKERKFLLSKEEFFKITSQECYYCGGFNVSENILIEKINLDYCGIDRIDNSIGYIIENCVPCCNICNRMKLDLSYNGFTQHIKKILEKIK